MSAEHPINLAELAEIPARAARKEKWDRRFLRLAQEVAGWSKDESSKCGAVIVRPDLTVVSLGFNGFPRGMDDRPELYADREVKYSRVIHAELNAILTARETVKGCTLYTNAPCCPRCCVHCLQAGIARFVFAEATPEQFKRWELDKTFAYLREANVPWACY